RIARRQINPQPHPIGCDKQGDRKEKKRCHYGNASPPCHCLSPWLLLCVCRNASDSFSACWVRCWAMSCWPARMNGQAAASFCFSAGDMSLAAFSKVEPEGSL